MQLIYIFQNDIIKQTADVHQSLQMSNSLSKNLQITFLTSRISRKRLNSLLNDYHLNGSVKFSILPIKLFTANIFIEYYSRLIYNFLVLIYLQNKKSYIIFTRDLSFLYLLSKLPRFLHPKAKIIFEAHKIYHKASNKVSLSQERKALAIPNFFIPTTKGIANELMETFEIPETKIQILGNGVNTQFFNTIKADYQEFYTRFPLCKGKKVIVYAGSFLDWKGIDIIIDAVSHLTQQNFYFLIIGGSGLNLEKYKKIISIKELNSYVAAYEKMPLNLVVNILKCAEIGIIPNNYSFESSYTSPLKISEYLAAGIPIIASDLPVFKEVLEENQNAIFFKTGQGKDLSDKIIQLSNNIELQQLMRKNNLEKAKNRDWNKRALSIKEIIDDLTLNKI